MSNSPPSTSSSGKGLSIPQKLALNAINEIQNRSNNYLHSKKGGKGLEEGRKRAALAAVISTVSSVGAERLSKAEFDELRDLTEQESPDKVHFMDKLTNKLIDALPRRSDETMDELRNRLEDRHRAEQPGLSIKRISRNFKTLSSKMDLVFSLQYSIIHVISWDQPSLTLTFLILYTWGCLMPYLFLVYPVLYVLTGVLIPNYLYRHPLAKPDIIPTRARGDSSIFGFLRTENVWELDRQRILLERGRALERMLSQELELSSISSRTSTDSEDEGSSSLLYEVLTADSKSNLMLKAVLEEDEETTEKGRKGVVDKVKLLINMRDLQNLTSDLIKMMTRMQDSIYENYSFKDEKRSTKHFFNLVALILITVVLGPYIPWRAIFIITVWILILLKHPKRQHILKQLKPATKHKLPPKQKTEVKRRASKLGELIVDDAPQYRTVQIFQIEKQDLIKPSVYELYMYSPSIFNESDTLRIQKKRPKGTTNLSLVQAPSSSWKFTEKKWTADTDPGSWCLENGVLDDMEIDGEWAYDKSGEYRRRRLVREVVRYSRPPKKR